MGRENNGANFAGEEIILTPKEKRLNEIEAEIKRCTEIKELILLIIEKRHIQNNPPTQLEIRGIIEEYKEQKLPGAKYESIQSSTNKKLKILLSDKKILQIREDNLTKYIPYDISKARVSIREDIIGNAEIKFSRPNIFVVSDNTVLIPIERGFSTAKEKFREYLGAINYFDMLEVDGWLMLLMNPDEIREIDYNVAFNKKVVTEEDKQKSAEKKENLEKESLRKLREAIAEIVAIKYKKK